MKKAIDLMEKLQTIIGAGFLFIYILCTALQIVTRYTPGFTATWSEEIANYSFIWSVFMGAAVMVRHQSHFQFIFFKDRLKGIAYKMNETIINLLLLGFSFFIFFYGVKLTRQFSNWSLSSLPNISQRYIWLALPVSGFTMMAYCIENLFKALVNNTEKNKIL